MGWVHRLLSELQSLEYCEETLRALREKVVIVARPGSDRRLSTSTVILGALVLGYGFLAPWINPSVPLWISLPLLGALLILALWRTAIDLRRSRPAR
jgi:hypothetical protein